MQLIKKMKANKNKVNLKIALTAATTALFGVSSMASAATESELDSWDFDTALLYYGEIDRVTAIETMLGATKTFDDDSILNLKITFDALTGASPNGAIAQPTVQTFTRPSGNGEYTAPPNETPIYDGFRDSRFQFNAQWTQSLSSNYTFSGGVHFSKEYDYLSLGTNGSLALDFNNKNSTFAVGLSYFQDSYNPVGGVPKPLSVMLPGRDITGDTGDDPTRIGTEDDKSTADIILGFTQIINRQMIMQFNYSYSIVDGYLNDPYKRLTRINDNGEAIDYLYESRPDTREKQSLFSQTKYYFEDSFLKSTVLDVSYRYMWDDWEIDSHTIDSRFYIPIGNDSYLEPHFRIYQQSAADFYQPFIKDSQPLPTFASADLRIGEMTTYTLGFKYGMFLQGNDELSFRIEYYTQQPTNSGFEQPGVLAKQELNEQVSAIIAQVTYSF